MGGANFSSATTEVITDTAVALFGLAQNPAGSVGLRGRVQVATGLTLGVWGEVISTDGIAVFGDSQAQSGINYGVRGACASPSGFALSAYQRVGGTALLAELPPSADQSGIAVYGLNNSSYAGPGPGAGGFGVYGLSAKGHGLVGATATPGGAAVAGSTNGLAGAYAGLFYGSVVVTGNFTVVGAKSAAVPHPDGSHRRLYCVESPESWFEDFGKARLEGGCASVAIDPDFAAVVDLTDYHVFLTGYDDFDLRVSEQSASGFHVVAKDVISSGRFSWRIVAKRKDIAAPRFEVVTVPPEPTLPSIPDVPAAR
jgi:hypothetical protein